MRLSAPTEGCQQPVQKDPEREALFGSRWSRQPGRLGARDEARHRVERSARRGGRCGRMVGAMSQTALITGTSTGMGLHTAIELAGRGFTVVATMRDASRRDA